LRFCYQEASSFTVHSVRNTAKSCDPIFMLVPSKYFSFEKKNSFCNVSLQKSVWLCHWKLTFWLTYGSYWFAVQWHLYW